MSVNYEKEKLGDLACYYGSGWRFDFIGCMSKFTQSSKVKSIRAIKVAVKKDRKNDNI